LFQEADSRLIRALHAASHPGRLRAPLEGVGRDARQSDRNALVDFFSGMLDLLTQALQRVVFDCFRRCILRLNSNGEPAHMGYDDIRLLHLFHKHMGLPSTNPPPWKLIRSKPGTADLYASLPMAMAMHRMLTANQLELGLRKPLFRASTT